MFKYLLFLAITLLLFSCNELSDEEMQIRLEELELMELANEHLEEDIEGLRQEIDYRLIISSNRPTIEPLLIKYNQIDSLQYENLCLSNPKNLDSLLYITNIFSNNLFTIIGKDSLNLIHFNKQTYPDSTISYPYSQLKSELVELHLNHTNFINSLTTPSDLEWKEIHELNRSYILVCKKRTINYLLELYVGEKIKLNTKSLNISIDQPSPYLKPKELYQVNIFTSVKYLPNYSLMSYYYDDSLIYDKTVFNSLYSENIYLPTSEIGKHSIRGSLFFRRTRKDTIKNNQLDFTFNYEVIENK